VSVVLVLVQGLGVTAWRTSRKMEVTDGYEMCSADMTWFPLFLVQAERDPGQWHGDAMLKV
jgi:hypothetical protein